MLLLVRRSAVLVAPWLLLLLLWEVPSPSANRWPLLALGWPMGHVVPDVRHVGGHGRRAGVVAAARRCRSHPGCGLRAGRWPLVR